VACRSCCCGTAWSFCRGCCPTPREPARPSSRRTGPGSGSSAKAGCSSCLSPEAPRCGSPIPPPSPGVLRGARTASCTSCPTPSSACRASGRRVGPRRASPGSTRAGTSAPTAGLRSSRAAASSSPPTPQLPPSTTTTLASKRCGRPRASAGC
jgi:hypothetical protein